MFFRRKYVFSELLLRVNLQIISKIDGIRCVKEIASLVSIDSDLVGRCIRNLYFYECVGIVPLFLYQNCYVATEKLHNFYEDKSKIQACFACNVQQL